MEQQNFPLGNVITPKHFVRFYEDDAALIKEVTQFISAGLDAGHGGIVIATQAHVDNLERRLSASGYDVPAAIEKGQYVALEAAETLSKFMVDGWPDEKRFHEVVGSVIAQAERRHSWIRAFGEMVALLWAEQRQEAALHLEKLWNGLSEVYAFSLFCAYPIRHFENEVSGSQVRDICTEHSHVLLPDRSRNLHFM